jgi:hypothetical protein
MNHVLFDRLDIWFTKCSTCYGVQGLAGMAGRMHLLLCMQGSVRLQEAAAPAEQICTQSFFSACRTITTLSGDSDRIRN